ncbi:MAG: ABC transporter substrate-binding protein [Spirochaetaceae bacterium]|nr:ABC transporter substrate-binding protein [Spirochaetaceae bacterium]
MRAPQALLPLFALCLLASACARPPLRVGLIAPMTGPMGNQGIEVQRGSSMATAEANNSGGVLGRKIELLLRDNRGEADATLAAIQELYGQGVKLVIIYTTSATAAPALAWAADKDLLILSHSVSDPRWTGLDDNFLRFAGSVDSFGAALGHFAEARGVRRVLAAIDLKNQDYARAFLKGFSAETPAVTITETKELAVDWSQAELAAESRRLGVDALLLVTPGLDAAKTGQALLAAGFGGILLLSPWSQDQNLLSYAGAFGNRIFLPSTTDPGDDSADFLAFTSRYKALFGEDPVMGSIYSYETIRFLAEGLRAAGKDGPKELKKAMLAKTRFPGLQYVFTLDAMGDSSMPYFIMTVEPSKGAFVAVGSVEGKDGP